MNRRRLSDVTLIAVTGLANDVDAAQAALLFSSEEIDFAAIKLVACVPPTRPAEGVEQHAIEPFDLIGYSRFVLHRLIDYVDTPFCLLVQSDGFVLNAEHWQDAFLTHDYIGAPWPAAWGIASRVGNGGFSLRSRRLLELTRELPYDLCLGWDSAIDKKAEDLWIGHYAHEWLCARGMRFPDTQLAMRFSMEHSIEEGGVDLTRTFGFHGNKKLAAYLLQAGRRQLLVEDMRQYSLSELQSWITSTAVNCPEYFATATAGRMQFEPQQFAALLDFLRSRRIRRYLALGIGSRGCLMASIMMMDESLEVADVADSSGWPRTEELTLPLYLFLKTFRQATKLSLHFAGIAEFLVGEAAAKDYDCIVVNVECSYENASQIFALARQRLGSGGCIVFGGLNGSDSRPLELLWEEVRNPACFEFTYGTMLGLRIWRLPQSP